MALSLLAQRRRPSSVLTLSGVAGVLALAGVAGPAAAQSRGTQMMVMDDGSGPMVLHFAGPDIRALKEPDYAMSDLPTFEEKLALDAAQRDAVRARIEAYLASFMTLARAELPAIDPMAFRMERAHGDPNGPVGPDGAPMGDFTLDLGGEGIDGVDIDIDGPGRIMIAVTASGGPGGGPGGEPGGAQGGAVIVNEDVRGRPGGGVEDPGVVISVETPDGAELSPEARKKLEEQAEKLAEKIRERMEKGEMMGGPIEGGLTGPERMAQKEQQFKEIESRANAFKEAKERLRRDFVVDVQAQLGDEQLDRWPSLDRALTRIKTLPKGRLDGERTDVLSVLAEVAPDAVDSPDLQEQCEAYEITLHDTLTRRNAFLLDADAKVNEAMRNGDPEKALTVLDRATRLRLGVRQTNEQFAASIESTLGGETAEAFRRRILEESYPRVYRPGTGLKAFEEARRLDGLREETLLRILDLESPYRKELDRVNARIKRTIDQYQPYESHRAIEQTRAIMDGEMGGGRAMAWSGDDGAELVRGGADDDPIRAAFQTRRDLDERSMKMLYDLLTPEQVALLPKLPSQRQRGPVMFRRAMPDPH